MRSSQIRRFEMLKRVCSFGEKNRELFPAGSLGGEAFDTLATSVTQLRAEAVSKQTSEREGRRKKAMAREALTVRLESLSRAARAIARDHPGFDESFHIPRPRSDGKLLTTGHAFVRQAEEVKARFVAYGLAEEFVTTLTVLVNEFEEALKSREDGKDGHTAARAAIEAALTSGYDAVRRLDIIVTNRLESDAVTMAVWERDRRVDAGRRSKKSVATAPEQPGAENIPREAA